MLKASLELKKVIDPNQILMTYGTFFDAKAILDFLLTGKIEDNEKQFFVKPHEWGLIVIFKNYLKNLDLEWDIEGVQNVLELQIEEKILQVYKIKNGV